MQRPDNSLLSSFTGSNIRFEEYKERLIFLQIKRMQLCLVYFKGKVDGKDVWHFILVDWDKKEEFFERSGKGILDGLEYGKILDSGWGCDIPDTVDNKTQKFINDLESKLFIFELQEDKEIYYVLCDDDKKSVISASKTVDDVRRCGRILYSSLDEDPPEALWDVIEKGYFEPIKGDSFVAFTESGIRVSRRGREVPRGGDVQKVRDFLVEVGDVDWTDGDGWTMLHHAAHCGDLDTIGFLKCKNANTHARDDICGRKPIHIAAREGHYRAVELLSIDSDSVNDVDKSGWTPLHYAAWKGEPNTVKYLLSKNAKTDIRDRCMGKKPIHVAVTEGHTDIVRIFLDNGANIDDGDAECRTLLYHSAFAGHFETAKLLIDRNANVEIANRFGTKPVHACANSRVVELLLNHGADIESRDSLGMTPLISATDINVVRILVEKGANLTAIDGQDKTPFDMALAKQHLEKASYLAERMSQMFQDKAKYSDALEVYEKLFKIQKEKLGQDHPNALKTQSNMALLLYEQGKYDETLETLNVILSKRQNILGPYHFETLCTKYEKGRVYVAQWKLDDAVETFKEVYESWQGTIGAVHHRTLGVARELAFVHFRKCEFDEALKICEDVYEKRKLSSGVNDPVTLQALQDVAIVLINKGENEKALRILEDVFAKRKEFLGAQHPETISAGYHIATVQKRLENTTEEGRCCLQ